MVVVKGGDIVGDWVLLREESEGEGRNNRSQGYLADFRWSEEVEKYEGRGEKNYPKERLPSMVAIYGPDCLLCSLDHLRFFGPCQFVNEINTTLTKKKTYSLISSLFM